MIFCPFLFISLAISLEQPQKIFFALGNMLAEHEGIILINLLGEYMASDMMPWHYRLVWFLITTPVKIILLFISGLVMSEKNH